MYYDISPEVTGLLRNMLNKTSVVPLKVWLPMVQMPMLTQHVMSIHTTTLINYFGENWSSSIEMRRCLHDNATASRQK